MECLLLIHRLDGLRFAEKSLLGDLFDCPSRIGRLGRPELEALLGRRLRPDAWLPATAAPLAKSDMAWLASGQGRCLVHGQPDYPPWLAEIDEPPFLLFCRGRLPDADADLLGVVGTRHPSEAGRLAAWDLGAECAEAGIGLVSGLAFGIDAAAHAGCVHRGGYSIAVLAGGIDQVQPRAHRQLVGRLLDSGGAVMSEYGPGTVARKWHFPVRNRIISGLCPAVVVVEAPEKSGALITAQFGLEQGRDVYVHAAGCKSPTGTGTKNLATSGAGVIDGLARLVSPGP